MVKNLFGKKGFVKVFTFFVISILLSTLLSQSVCYVYAERFVPINFDCYATVIEVIDGDAMKVEVWETGEVGLIRVIGVDAKGNTDAFRYIADTLMGTVVMIKVDPKLKANTGGVWSYVHVVKNDVYISEKLISMGLAGVNESHKNALNYVLLVEAKEMAEANGVGDYYVAETEVVVGEKYTGDKININTATAAQISGFLNGISATLATNITAYRDKNPISEISELKFIDGFTREIWAENSEMISVVTDMSKATTDEMMFLKNFRQTDAERIDAYRVSAGIASLNDIIKNKLITDSLYEANIPFMTLNGAKTLDYSVPEKTVEINTAEEKDLVAVGLTESQAAAVIKARGSYTFKTVNELRFITDAAFTQPLVDQYEDNLVIAEYSESGYLNLNTATFKQLRDLGVEYSDAEKVYAMRGKIRSWGEMPADLTAFESKITLYTNINKASEKELYSLGEGMTKEIVDKLLTLRAEQPFGSMAEVRTVFEGLKLTAVYNAVSPFIVVR